MLDHDLILWSIGQRSPASEPVLYDGHPQIARICNSSVEAVNFEVFRNRTDTYKIEPSFIDSQSLIRPFNMVPKFCVWETEYRFSGCRFMSDLLR